LHSVLFGAVMFPVKFLYLPIPHLSCINKPCPPVGAVGKCELESLAGDALAAVREVRTARFCRRARWSPVRHGLRPA